MTWGDILIILSGLPWTLAVTGLSLAIGIVLGFPLMFARNSKNRVLSTAMIMLIALIRSVPPIVWLFIVSSELATGLCRSAPSSRR